LKRQVDDAKLRTRSGEDAGFSIIEIVVSMFILAIIAVAALPLLIQGLQVTSLNATRSTATQLVHDQLELARAQDSTCSTIAALNGDAPSATDPRGAVMKITRSISACPSAASAYPTTVTMTVTVRRQTTGVALSTATTRIYVKKAS
jgi:prepilin-type N-terminal cleavage/methylation domain-containing protein